MWPFGNRKCKLDHCVEQTFFTTVIAICLATCFAVILFDMVVIPRNDNQVRLAIIFAQLLLLSLFAVDRINFNCLTSCSLAIMSVLFTYRGLAMDGFEDITCIILITVGFLTAIVTNGRSNLVLKIAIFACLLMILFKGADSASALNMFRRSLPYIAIYLIITICSGLLKARYEANQSRLSSLVELLNKKNAQIYQQHELLQQNIWKLTSLNGDLETLVDEKTRRIAEKNRQLSNIAHLNAHQVRAPLARILGLLQLIDFEPDRTEFYIGLLNDQAREMDEKLRMVSRSIDANMYDAVD